MTHWASSRDGLFVFDEDRGHLAKVADGAYFGMARLNQKVFIFGFEGDRLGQNDMGSIWSFYYKKGKVFNFQKEFTGLDNGCHQMVIFDGHLYVPETYLQRLVKIRIDSDDDLVPDSVEYLNLWPEARNVHYEGGGTDEYMHVNAVTVQDDRFFFMCPYLGRKKLDRTSKIQVWDPRTWTLIDEYELGKWFCHDLVMVGHEVYFCDALNSICKLNLVTRSVTEVYVQPKTPIDTRNICRALSISSNLEFLASTTVPKGPAVMFTRDKVFEVQFENSFTGLTRMDRMDFNDPESPLRKSQVRSFQAASLNFFSKMIGPAADLFSEIQSRDFSTYEQCTEVPEDRPCPENMVQFLNPKFDTFSDLEPYIDRKEKVIGLGNPGLGDLVLPDEFKGTPMYPMSGSFYYYAKGHGMGWHTNQLQVRETIHTDFRCYFVKTTGGTFFFYRHPVSKRVHAVHDVDASVNIFRLDDEPNFFWHAIGSVTGNRLSVGYRSSLRGILKLSEVISDVVYDQ